MVKRLFDIILSIFAIVVLAPIILFATLGIKLSSKGPVFYKAKRTGKNGIPFTMYKFRSMNISTESKSAITGANDSRIFSFGNFLRKSKIDELPQLFNVLKGEMSIVGPRPEDIRIVENYYTDKQYETLSVMPGLASPGSIFNYTHGDTYIGEMDAEREYIEKLLPVKLNIELYYVKNRSLTYDFKIILRTIITIIQILFGEKNFGYPIEYYEIIQTEKKT
ncbi:sugar transferase [Lutibacter sp. B2]|nr:sugar transferase [Lutibacter sp. B2]